MKTSTKGVSDHLKPYMVKASIECITITKANLDHSCETTDHYFRGIHTNLDHLVDHIMEIIIKNRTTRAYTIRDTTHALVHPNIQYHTTYSTKKLCIICLDGSNKDLFYLIPAHYEHILDKDPSAMAKWSAPNQCFEILFICPFASRHTFVHNRTFVAFDGMHTKCTYPKIFLLATTLDANNTIVILAYAMVPSKNERKWRSFMTIAGGHMQDSVFISDQKKDLLPSVCHVFPIAYQYHSTSHLGDNIQTGFGKKWVNVLDGLVYATTPD